MMNEINQKKLTRWNKDAKELRHQGRIEREKREEGKDVKYDYEGDLDGFELWLKNWNKDDDWETYMNEVDLPKAMKFYEEYEREGFKNCEFYIKLFQQLKKKIKKE